MKLTKSVDLLRTYMQQNYSDSKGRALMHYLYTAARCKASNPMNALRWALWYSLQQSTRSAVLNQSVGDKSQVGAYFEGVSEGNIDALLRKAMPIAELAEVLALAAYEHEK